MADYTALGQALVLSFNQRVGQKNTTDSIDPVDVSGCDADIVNQFVPILNTINAFTIRTGTTVPDNSLGIEDDVYFRGATGFIEVYQKRNGIYTLGGTIPLGITFPNGNISLQSSISGQVITISAGSWGINNAIYQKPVQTQFTVNPANLSFDRIDAVFADDSSTITYVAGTASSNPDSTKPDTPSSAIVITYIYVPNSSSGNLPYIADSNVPVVAETETQLFNQDDIQDTSGDQNWFIPVTLSGGNFPVGVFTQYDYSTTGNGEGVKNIPVVYQDGKLFGFDDPDLGTQAITVKIQ